MFKFICKDKQLSRILMINVSQRFSENSGLSESHTYTFTYIYIYIYMYNDNDFLDIIRSIEQLRLMVYIFQDLSDYREVARPLGSKKWSFHWRFNIPRNHGDSTWFRWEKRRVETVSPGNMEYAQNSTIPWEWKVDWSFVVINHAYFDTHRGVMCQGPTCFLVLTILCLAVLSGLPFALY